MHKKKPIPDMIKPMPRCTTCRTKNISLLRGCCADVLESLSDKKSIHSFKKSERLLTAGEEAKGIYCIRSGIAKVEIQNAQDQTLLLRLVGEGAMVGYRTAEKRDKQPLTVTAIENMQVCRFSTDDFRGMVSADPGLHNEIVRHLLNELQDVENRALSLACNSVKERIAASLLHIADIYNYKQNGCSIHIHLDRQDLADLAGTTKEQVSHILAQFRQLKLINYKSKHFKYFDLNGLRAIARISQEVPVD